MEGWLAWLQASAPAAAMRGGVWLYPIVETIHIVGFVLLVGAVAMFDLRLLGLGRALPLRALARHLLPWSVAGLLVVVPTGLLLFSTQPQAFIANRAFLIKLALIAAAGLNAALFHWQAGRHMDGWQAAIPVPARLHAAASLLLWVAVIAAGRMIAYL